MYLATVKFTLKNDIGSPFGYIYSKDTQNSAISKEFNSNVSKLNITYGITYVKGHIRYRQYEDLYDI